SLSEMPTLGVNIDHIATIRQARLAPEPDPVTAAAIAELAGADGITVHLREDRRHIQDRDLEILRQTVQTHLNLEMAATPEMIKIALETRPDYVTLVPEKRTEVTTEGGLDLIALGDQLLITVEKLQSAGIPASLFIDPDSDQIQAAARAQAQFIELHTGTYANHTSPQQLQILTNATAEAISLGLRVNAGHGLTYTNVQAIAKIPGMEELNIGHSIISRAVLVGLDRAVREMKHLIVLNQG
ncbi:MAG: pyridoxine 5'-phosphate synthase, partial [Pseudanabaenaceae cyanobacterium bins.68]|nr:pyridoxine 5'-phosphate synthase [Pseudanabaenaceae cyanobacterium bins.68]